MNQIVSLSGGKDSTAMLHMMIERGEPIHSVVHFDTGWEFPKMLLHLNAVERRTGLPIVRLQPPRSFDYWLTKRKVRARSSPRKGEVVRIGSGWPSPLRRWCTREKINAIEKYARTVDDSVLCVGYAWGEERRLNRVTAQRFRRRFPLMEWKMTGAEALTYCRELGYTWGGLYDYFDRVSCFCCPLQRLDELRALRRHFPALWERMLDMDSRIRKNRGFNHNATVHDLERRFTDEERQLVIGAPEVDD